MCAAKRGQLNIYLVTQLTNQNPFFEAHFSDWCIMNLICFMLVLEYLWDVIIRRPCLVLICTHHPDIQLLFIIQRSEINEGWIYLSFCNVLPSHGIVYTVQMCFFPFILRIYRQTLLDLGKNCHRWSLWGIWEKWKLTHISTKKICYVIFSLHFFLTFGLFRFKNLFICPKLMQKKNFIAKIKVNYNWEFFFQLK